MSTIESPCPIPQSTLDQYVQLVFEGRRDEDIWPALGVTPGQIKRFQPYFLAYFRDSIKQHTMRAAVQNRLEDIFPLFEPLKERFMDCLRAGLSLDKAARAINIPLPIITEGWYKDKYFKSLASMVVEMSNVEVEKALYKRAIGFTHDQEDTTECKSEGKSAEGIPFSSTTTTTHRRTKIVYGDPRAQEVWLYNRSPDRWQNGGLPGDRDDKGTIMELIDELLREDDEDSAGDKEDADDYVF